MISLARLTLIVACALCPAAATTLQPATAPTAPADLDVAAIARKVDAYMQAQVKTNGFRGAVLLARQGAPLVSKGYGWANAEWEIPNTPQTKFRLGSITKQFTSMTVMR